MVLKLCGGLWQSQSQGQTEEDVEAAAIRQKKLQELLNGGAPIVRTDAAKFAKETRILFDSKRAHGVLFDAVNDESGYTCNIAGIDDETESSQATEHNARCKASGVYSRILVVGMRVRSINGADQKGVAFTKVKELLEINLLHGCTITFADVMSKPVSPRPRLKAVTTMVLATQRAKKTTTRPSMKPVSPSLRRATLNANVSPMVSKWSSVLTAVTEQVHATQSDVLASDLAHKSKHLEAELLRMKGRVATLEKEKADALQQASEVQAALMDEMQKQRDEAQAKDAEWAKKWEALQRENEALLKDMASREGVVEKLQHQYDTVVLEMQELRMEHSDVHINADELHTRLEATQKLNAELTEKLTATKQQREKEIAVVEALRKELQLPVSEETSHEHQQPHHLRRRRASAALEETDSPVVAFIKQLVLARDDLQTQYDELQIEMSCHDATIHTQEDSVFELEEKIASHQEANNALKEQVKSFKEEQSKREALNKLHEGTDPHQIELRMQLDAERDAKARIEAALQVLEDNARAKLEQHEKEQFFLTQFKEQLVKGISVIKYGTRGSPHVRVLHTDPQCRWITWRQSGAVLDSASAPKAGASAEIMELVEVLLGAKTETFQHHRPEVPGRCLSLVFCVPCRTLDFEVENRERAMYLRRGFQLLAEEAAEKRRFDEEHTKSVVRAVHKPH